MSNRLDGEVLLEKNEGVLIWQDYPSVTDFLQIFFVDIDPNGVFSAPKGSLASGPLGLWMNFDGATGWTPVSTIGGSGTVDVSGNTDIPAIAQFVKVNTDAFEWLMFLPALASVPDGKTIIFKSISGFLDAIINPNNLAEGVNGPPGTAYTLNPGNFVTLRADKPALTWWIVET